MRGGHFRREVVDGGLDVERCEDGAAICGFQEGLVGNLPLETPPVGFPDVSRVFENGGRPKNPGKSY